MARGEYVSKFPNIPAQGGNEFRTIVTAFTEQADETVEVPLQEDGAPLEVPEGEVFKITLMRRPAVRHC